MLSHPPRARETGGHQVPPQLQGTHAAPHLQRGKGKGEKMSKRDRASRREMKMQGGVCNDSERSGSFPSIARPANVFFPKCELLLPSSENEESSSPLISSTPILKITAAPSGLGTEVFSPIPAKGIDPGSVGQRDPEIATSPRELCISGPHRPRCLRGISNRVEGRTGWGDKLEGCSSAKPADKDAGGLIRQ